MRSLRAGPVFEARLLEIARYFAENDVPDRYWRLLTELETRIFPNIQRFPGIGRPFSPDTVSQWVEWERLRALLAAEMGAAEVREYIADAHMILYAFNEQEIYFLSIRHFRQREADFLPV